MKDATYGASTPACPAIASSLDTAAIGRSKTSLHAFTVVSPIRTPVNEPGPGATANNSMSFNPKPDDCSKPLHSGQQPGRVLLSSCVNSGLKHVGVPSTATLPCTSHVSIANTIIYEPPPASLPHEIALHLSDLKPFECPSIRTVYSAKFTFSAPKQLECQIGNQFSLTLSFHCIYLDSSDTIPYSHSCTSEGQPFPWTIKSATRSFTQTTALVLSSKSVTAF